LVLKRECVAGKSLNAGILEDQGKEDKSQMGRVQVINQKKTRRNINIFPQPTEVAKDKAYLVTLWINMDKG
jgi:hypothetical protein